MSEMDEKRCRTRIVLRSGTAYMVFETLDEVRQEYALHDVVEVVSWGGSDLLPPERLAIVGSEIAAMQEMSDESWLFSQHATTLHYARQLRELEESPSEKTAAAVARLVDSMGGDA